MTSRIKEMKNYEGSPCTTTQQWELRSVGHYTFGHQVQSTIYMQLSQLARAS